MKALAGSRLYGTSVATSDFDFKVVFAHTLEGLIFRHKDTFRTKEPEKNEESEFFSAHAFIDRLASSQTIPIELLFAPTKFYHETSKEWEELVAHRDLVVSKHVIPFVKYARDQAQIYSIKGNKLEYLRHLINTVLPEWSSDPKETCHGISGYLQSRIDAGDTILIQAANLDNLSWGDKPTPHGAVIRQVNICGKGFEEPTTIETWVKRLQIQEKKFGERADLAAANGGHDTKATYHAVRIGSEAIELLETGKLEFPARNADLLLKIRNGEVSYQRVCELVEENDITIDNIRGLSDLREAPDTEFLNNWLMRTQTHYAKL